MSKHLLKVETVLKEALIARGFSDGEAMQMISRLSAGEIPEEVSRERKPHTMGITTRMPFGKYRGMELRDIKSSYLLWISNEEWFEVKFYSLGEMVNKEIERRKTEGTL